MISDVFVVDSIATANNESTSGDENREPQTESYAYFEVYNVLDTVPCANEGKFI